MLGNICYRLLVPLVLIYTVTEGCPSSRFEEFSIDGLTLCFLSPNLKANWAEAQAWCMAEDAWLATLEFAGHEMLLEGYLASLNRKNKQVWLGGTDATADGVWRFYDPTTAPWHLPLAYTNWRTGFPRVHRHKSCLYLKKDNIDDGAWMDDNCNTKKEFVCMYESSSTK